MRSDDLTHDDTDFETPPQYHHRHMNANDVDFRASEADFHAFYFGDHASREGERAVTAAAVLEGSPTATLTARETVHVGKDNETGARNLTTMTTTESDSLQGLNDARRDGDDPEEKKRPFQVVILGASGGPVEDNVTGLLVRATAEEWSPRSLLAVDAGTLLGGILRILEQHLPKSCAEAPPPSRSKTVLRLGPFAGLGLPHVTAKANAAHIFRELLGTICVTHAHLDHMSGLAINTPLINAGKGPKIVAALPSTIAAIREHLFNDITWPNLSDEDGGVGFVTYQRLVEGGNPRFGTGEGRGYVQVCPGLGAKCLPVSHGRCQKKYSAESGKYHRANSRQFARDRDFARRLSQTMEGIDPHASIPGTPNPGHVDQDVPSVSVNSSAFFIRDDASGSEMIIFGDIEPDSVSIDPRNYLVWEAAAPKFVAGTLKAIFIECSYDDDIDDKYLFGHLCPRHLISELLVLAEKVEDVTRVQAEEAAAYAADASSSLPRKRKRASFQVGNAGNSLGVPRQKVRHQSVFGTPRSSSWQYGMGSGSAAEHSYFPFAGGFNASLRRTSRTPMLSPSSAATPVFTGSRITSRSTLSGAIPAPPPPPIVTDADEDNASPMHGLLQEPTQITEMQDLSDSPQTLQPRRLDDQQQQEKPKLLLEGLKVYIIHVKDTMEDGPGPGVRILEELNEHKDEVGLGCVFHVTQAGESYFI